MKIIVFSDIHQDWEALEKITAKKADIYICLGDLSNRGKGLEKAGGMLAFLKEKLWLMPGNNETPAQIKALSKKHGFIDFHGTIIEKNGFNLAGLGLVTPTPFNTPGETSEQEFEKAFKKFTGLKNLVLFVHNPPKNSIFDQIPNGAHVGGQVIRDFINNRLPLYFFSGHVHEHEGKIERIGKTTCFGVGKKGLELWL
ncbi:metallophosphoesterase [Candidatus Microgenomates bacterium]|nr:metallophosphoesterase [Candidatus Microgenomates bacterium]